MSTVSLVPIFTNMLSVAQKGPMSGEMGTGTKGDGDGDGDRDGDGDGDGIEPHRSIRFLSRARRCADFDCGGGTFVEVGMSSWGRLQKSTMMG